MPSPFQTRNIAHLTANYTTVKEVTSADATLTSADTGKLIVVDASGGEVIITLPAAEVGLTFDIQVWKHTDSLVINAPSSANYFKGGFSWRDPNNGDAQVSFSAADGSSEYRLDMPAPEIGTKVQCVCDGTLWWISGTVVDNDITTWS